jgi:transcriptional regulator of acetoin/glycerol metabolism
VRRGQLATFGLLAQAFADEPNVRLIWDRRIRDRRQESGSRPDCERRRTDRRRATPATWDQHDYVVLGARTETALVSVPEVVTPATITPMTPEEVARDIETAIALDLNIMITGGDPISRNSLAHQIHRRSRRNGAPLLVIDRPLASAVFSGSRRVVRPASGGVAMLEADRSSWADLMVANTWLIEEVADLTWEQQIELLRVIEGNGESARSPREPRIISASGYELFQRVEKAQFHRDLFYRLNIVHVVLPPGIVRSLA